MVLAGLLECPPLPAQICADRNEHARIWSRVIQRQIDPHMFILTVGVYKILGIAALHGAFGDELDDAANLAFVPHLFGAGFTHMLENDFIGMLGPAFMLA